MYIQIRVHDAFLEWRSSGTFMVKTLCEHVNHNEPKQDGQKSVNGFLHLSQALVARNYTPFLNILFTYLFLMNFLDYFISFSLI
jgi:hypothetical protein